MRKFLDRTWHLLAAAAIAAALIAGGLSGDRAHATGGANAGVGIASLGKTAFFAGPTAGAATNIFTPAVNTNGVILRTANISNLGGTGQVALMSGLTAPGTVNCDSAHQCILATSTAANSVSTLPFQIFIPAGFGLFCTNGNATNGSDCQGSYDQL